MTERPEATERRVAPRHPLDVPGLAEREPRSAGTPFLVKVRVRDINHKGAFIWAPPIFRIGERLRVEIEVNPELGHTYGLNITFSGEVVRVESSNGPAQPPGFGIRIIQFDTPRLAVIQTN